MAALLNNTNIELKMKKSNILSLAILVFLVIACNKNNSDDITYDCSGLVPTYIKDVKPIMDANCATSNCHSSSTRASGIDLSSYNAVKSFSGDSKFIKSMQHRSGVSPMPRGASKLDDNTIKQVYCWIQNGTPEQ